jgi:hypothetical protein
LEERSGLDLLQAPAGGLQPTKWRQQLIGFGLKKNASGCKSV